MNSAIRLALLSVVTLSAFAANADMLGPAADYNVFIFGNGTFQSANTESLGNVAAGGNVSLQNYSVARAIVGNAQSDPNPARLVVGGNLTATSGGVGQGQGGAIYVGGTTNLTSFTATGGTFGQTLIDFSTAANEYLGLSSVWGSLAATGTSVLGDGNTLTLTGGNSGLNVFSLSAAMLTASNTVEINATPGSTVLINVTGDNAVFQNGMVFLNGISSAYVMYNFIDATSVNLAGGKNPMGSILAPFAGVTGGFGAMDGQLITGSYQGNTEFHWVGFEGTISPVPLPAGIWLLLTGIGALGAAARRRFAP